MGIHHLPQLALFCESDTFISVEGFKNNSEAAVFLTLGKYLHLVDLNA